MPSNVIKLLNRGITTAVVSTIDKDGYPHTAPFHWIVAIDAKTLRIGINTRHTTMENIRRNGRVMVCIIDEGNIAVGVKGMAKVIKERMEKIPWPVAMVEVTIKEVKSDTTKLLTVIQGVRFKASEEGKAIIEKAFEELKSSKIKPV